MKQSATNRISLFRRHQADPRSLTPHEQMDLSVTTDKQTSMTDNMNTDEVIIMKEFWNTVQMAFAAVGGWLGWFLGGCDGPLIALVVFVILDYITGVMRAVADHQLSSAVGFRGLFRKVLLFALVGVGQILDSQVIGAGGVLRTAIIFFYLSNEGISLLENASYLGLPVPEKLKDVLEQLHDRAEEEKDGEEDPVAED